MILPFVLPFQVPYTITIPHKIPIEDIDIFACMWLHVFDTCFIFVYMIALIESLNFDMTTGIFLP